MLISFDDPATGTSNIKLIRQSGAFDISKLQAAYKLYWKVIHDDISVKDASTALDNLMRKPSLYNKWQLIFFGGMCSASICTVSFNGSFLDALISFPLGCLLIIIQLFAARHELYSNVFEITVATLFSFVAAALASTGHFCYSAVAASSVVLILPVRNHVSVIRTNTDDVTRDISFSVDLWNFRRTTSSQGQYECVSV